LLRERRAELSHSFLSKLIWKEKTITENQSLTQPELYPSSGESRCFLFESFN